MDGYRAFEMRTGPYIPERHLGYGLLPELTASGGEVFSYPAELNEVDGMVIKCKVADFLGQRKQDFERDLLSIEVALQP